ncbi:LOW QUALITY PROTEIN: plexin-A1-like [Pollicipes pollicipes]|uniref:LOW QUALITY PROTEIN: plexin-A1-like n=1 Tax=Pollicipes pollicipes TaxID=41117 RepID=UPI001884B861|nr:LOW QUALITY PROTEIN: plexin-A1-like [Pollicipes pollicipes]
MATDKRPPLCRVGAARGMAGPHWPPWALCATLLATLAPAAARASYIVKEFSDSFVTDKLNHMVVDEHTGRVYVGAINRLYQLSRDLDLVISVETGPEDDDPECSPANECPAYVVKRPTDNVNKALVIDKTHGTLIVCGSLFQGRCQVRNLHNVSVVERQAEEAVVANNETASTVAFIAPGPPNPPETHVLYVGVTFTGGARAPYRNEVPAVSSRSLDRDRMFTISELAVTTGTRMSINSLARERYYISYVYGFGSNGFSYFLTTQMRRSTETSPYISKLVRVCQDDPHYYSYTEIPIDCIDDKGIKYNLAQAAHVATAGSDVATKLGITAQDDVFRRCACTRSRTSGTSLRATSWSATAATWIAVSSSSRPARSASRRCRVGAARGMAGPHWPPWALCATLLATLAPAAARASYIVKEFSDSFVTDKLNHMVVDEHTGRVYVGAINRLYQLSRDLDLVISVETGPEDDDPECSPANECPAYVVKRPTDNVNKALVIDKTHGTLIVCGSLFQGRCQVRNLHNVSVVERQAEEAVVANNETASTVAFIAPGPPNPPETHVLYVGVTFTGGARAPYRNEVPAVSSRSLDRDRMFTISELAVTTGTRMSINSLARERYYISYVYGFGSNGFSYFLTTQARRSTETSPYISKLVRVCQDDPHYYSYTEIPIDCIDDKGIKYNLAQAAHVATAGSDVATKLGITAQDDVLYAVFSVSERSEGENSDKPTNKSALCVYSLKDIRHKFTRNIMEECYRGNVDRGLEFISPGKKCVSTKFELLETVGEDFCGMDVNTPIGGSMAVTAVAVLTVDTLLTSVAATSTGDFTVVFAGTATGHIKKVVVEPLSERKIKANEYGDLAVQHGSRVQADLRFDKRKQHLYVMTEKKVSKVKVQECHLYASCGECLGARDPYCGWCSLENK